MNNTQILAWLSRLRDDLYEHHKRFCLRAIVREWMKTEWHTRDVPYDTFLLQMMRYIRLSSRQHDPDAESPGGYEQLSPPSEAPRLYAKIARALLCTERDTPPTFRRRGKKGE